MDNSYLSLNPFLGLRKKKGKKVKVLDEERIGKER